MEHEAGMEPKNYSFSTILSCTVAFNRSKTQQESRPFAKCNVNSYVNSPICVPNTLAKFPHIGVTDASASQIGKSNFRERKCFLEFFSGIFVLLYLLF